MLGPFWNGVDDYRLALDLDRFGYEGWRCKHVRKTSAETVVATLVRFGAPAPWDFMDDEARDVCRALSAHLNRNASRHIFYDLRGGTLTFPLQHLPPRTAPPPRAATPPTTRLHPTPASRGGLFARARPRRKPRGDAPPPSLSTTPPSLTWP